MTMIRETTFKLGHELETGDLVMSLGRPRRIEGFTDYDSARVGLTEAGWRIAHDGLGWIMTIEPQGHHQVVVF